MIDLYPSKIGPINQKGFTLVEVLIAMVVATIGLLSLFMLQGRAVKGNMAGSECTQAVFLAQQTLERIKDGFVAAEGTFGFMDMSHTDGNIILDSGKMEGIDGRGDMGGRFNLQWQVTANTDWSRRVTVNVSWNSILGLTRHVRLTSISRGDGT